MATIAFIDSETRSPLDLTVVGARKYAAHPGTEALVWGYLFDEQVNGRVWSPEWAWGYTVAADHEPTDLLDHVENGGFVAAWNAFFDRWIWNEVMVKKYDWPYLRPDRTLCAQAQAEANNLPGSLEKACLTLGTPYQKDPQGRKLIELLCKGTCEDWSGRFETADRMGHFRAYCLKDCLAMRDVWKYTRPLSMDEWAEYHASEKINDRGIMADVPFAAMAATYAREEEDDINGELVSLTGDDGMSVTAHIRKAKWLHTELWPDEELQTATERPNKEGKKRRYSCDRQTREVVLDALANPEHYERFETEHAEKIISFLELVEAGNSAAVRKFSAIVNQELGGRIYGSYAFNGAGQTGRFSSRGVQIHNLIRDPVEKGNPDRAMDAIDDIMAGVSPIDLEHEYGFSFSRLLSRLIRPTFIAPEGKTLLWGDWDQIEGRGLPWLASSPGAERKLDLYRRGEDPYVHAAARIFNLPPSRIGPESKERQIGKVAELALGFGGGVGAFRAMGRNYGVLLSDAAAQTIVTAWRSANPWAREFWDQLWQAALNAWKDPGVWYTAGRIKYLFHETLMRGTLICMLPDGRWLVYPQFKREEYEDDNGVLRIRTTFIKGYGSGAARVDLWHGVLAENGTQAMAASILRRTLVLAQDEAVLHTHDEIGLEIRDTLRDIEDASEWLTDIMTDHPEADAGLPLSVSLAHGPFYTK